MKNKTKYLYLSFLIISFCFLSINFTLAQEQGNQEDSATISDEYLETDSYLVKTSDEIQKELDEIEAFFVEEEKKAQEELDYEEINKINNDLSQGLEDMDLGIIGGTEINENFDITEDEIVKVVKEMAVNQNTLRKQIINMNDGFLRISKIASILIIAVLLEFLLIIVLFYFIFKKSKSNQ